MIINSIIIPVAAQTNTISIHAGLTCGSIDTIAEDSSLPDMKEGGLIIGHMMGAYSATTTTQVNSLLAAKIIIE